MMLEIAFKAALVLATAGLAALTLRRASAATRHLVWTAGVVVVLALPLLVTVVPRRSLPGAVVASGVAENIATRVTAAIDDYRSTQDQPTQETEPGAPAISSAPSVGAVSGDRTGKRNSTTIGAGAEAPIAAASVAQNDERAEPRTPASERTTALGAGRSVFLWAAWLVGVSLVLTLLVTERVRLGLTRRRARRCTEGPLFDALLRLSHEAGLQHPPSLLLADRQVMPMTWGSLAPAILIPATADRWSASRRDAVLRHEIAHIRRRDDLAQIAGTLVAALHWFNPLAWVALRRLRLERELACDDEVLGHGGKPSSYARELLEIASTLQPKKGTALAAQSMARPSQLSNRLLAVLEESRRRGALRRRTVVAAALIGMAFALPLASIAGTPPEPASDSGTVSPRGPAPTPTTWVVSAQVSECWAPHTERDSTSASDSDRQIYTFVWRSRGCRGDIRLVGELTFNEDFSRIVGLSPGGSFRIEIIEDGGERRLEITEATDGGLDFDWRVDGRGREFDEEARRWFSQILTQVLRETGYAAAERVAWIYGEQGAAGVFAEVRLMSSNSGRSRYLVALVGQPGVSHADVGRALEISRDEIDSNSGKTRVLGAVSDRYRSAIVGGALESAYWRTLDSVDSNSSTSRALSRLIQGEPQDSALVGRVIEEATARIDSNSTLSRFLRDLRRAYPGIATSGDQASRYWVAVEHIDSNSTMQEFLLDISEGEPIDSRLVARVFDTASSHIDSNSTRSEFLLTVARRYPDIAESGPRTEEFWTAAREIDSSSTMSEFLLSLVSGKNDNSAALDRALAVGAEEIGSGSQMGRFLVGFARQHPGAVNARLRDELLDAARSIGSRSSRERALEELRDLGIG